MNVSMSWVEQFMNWYPHNTKLYRRRSKNDPADYISGAKQHFDELKPFFMHMADTIWNKALAKEREDRLQLCQAILQCRTLAEAQAMARQAVSS